MAGSSWFPTLKSYLRDSQHEEQTAPRTEPVSRDALSHEDAIRRQPGSAGALETEGDWQDASAPKEDQSGATGLQSTKGMASLSQVPNQDEVLKLVAQMPSLLSTDLPPCGAEVQVAYENIVSELRYHWLLAHGQKSVDQIIATVERYLKEQYQGQNPLTYWRRTSVLEYENQWLAYFGREARMTEPLTESELLERSKEPSKPVELNFVCAREDVLKQWEVWHKKKRAASDTGVVHAVW